MGPVSTVFGDVILSHLGSQGRGGVIPKMIGTHSIRKGAVTYMSSLPGGPSISSVCIHAGWTMGTVKYVYMQYLSLGDQFVGHCLAMLPLLQMEFASSPPILFQCGMTGGKPTVHSSSLCLRMYHSLCILN